MPEMTKSTETGSTEKVSLLYIFWVFLKLGATAFGGYMSLVAIVQKQLVEIDKKLKEEDLLDGISLTSVLPGPVAVNVIAYVGYKLRGVAGAMASFVAITIPSFLLVLFLSWFYVSYGSVPAVKNFFLGITPAVTALILTVAIGMARKNMKSKIHWAINLVSMLLLILIGGIQITFVVMIGGALIGYCCFFKREEKEIGENDKPDLAQISRKQWGISVCVVLLLLALLLFAGQQTESPILWQIASTFSGISLTLFGGGYVVIPALHELFVDNLGWLTSPEFADGIAIGQVTPGPIFITATFIGYLVAGFWGALIATVSIFTPPAVLTVLLSRFIEVIRDSKVVKAMLQGIRAAVIGMIFASAITIGNTMPLEVRTIGLFLINFGISYKYNLNPIFLILGSGLIGLILFAI